MYILPPYYILNLFQNPWFFLGKFPIYVTSYLFILLLTTKLFGDITNKRCNFVILKKVNHGKHLAFARINIFKRNSMR